MNQFLNKMERKIGRYAIPNLINYVIVLYCLGGVLEIINPRVYYVFFALDIGKILQGQIWRLFTFVLAPVGISQSAFLGIIFFAIKVYIFLMFGRFLEQAWGTFRFNLYFFSGILFNILGGVIIYVFTGQGSYVGLEYIYQSMFFAFALLNPNMQFLLYFVIPIKVKWLAIVDGVFIIFLLLQSLMAGQYYVAAAILAAFSNFLIFFFVNRDFKRLSPGQVKRRRKFKAQVRSASGGSTRHKCVICGRTELDNPSLDFRYCSKCEGNYEYCSDHLFTHEHVK